MSVASSSWSSSASNTIALDAPFTQSEKDLVDVKLSIRGDTSDDREVSVAFDDCVSYERFTDEVVDGGFKHMFANRESYRAVWLRIISRTRTIPICMRPGQHTAYRKFLRQVKAELRLANGEGITVTAEIELLP